LTAMGIPLNNIARADDAVGLMSFSSSLEAVSGGPLMTVMNAFSVGLSRSI